MLGKIFDLFKNKFIKSKSKEIDQEILPKAGVRVHHTPARINQKILNDLKKI